jgi:exodeoxyribonuclease V alpha subunit
LGDLCGRGHSPGFSTSFCTEIENLTGENLRDRTPHEDQQGALNDCIVQLDKSYRFAEDSCIGELSQSLNRGDSRRAFELLTKSSDASVRLRPAASHSDLQRKLKKTVLQGYRDYLTDAGPYEALEKFNQFRLLCAVNKGPLGVAALNRLAEQILSEENLIHPDHLSGNPWYAGRPIMITRNDYHMGLFNGDIGLTMTGVDSDADRLYVYFPDTKGVVRQVAPYRLSDHQTVYALTVHKSQGSEFEDVHLLLPDTDMPVLTRELIYTAVTRARRSVTIWGTEKILRAAIDRKIQRSSGLRDALWGRASQG